MRERTLLRTKRMELIPGTPELLRAETENQERFADLLGASVPDGWPPEEVDQATLEFMALLLEEGPHQAGWWCWYFILKGEEGQEDVLIGNGGFKGRPSPRGTVEIGYSIHPSFRNRGYATEAVKELVAWAFDHPRVRRVVADTLPPNEASKRVLEKAGFVDTGTRPRRRLMRFALERPDALDQR
jgi:ribosomal-protein-alanine N-acetyltransferase